ncbi:MAG TPA: ATP-binding protein [Candidatus Bathyarchaeia archaeon]|nr:ATP-binding protein [Candidatus Bathyarchaeia archaeon]
MAVGKPPKEIIDREKEVTKLVRSLSDPSKDVNYALIGPRRIGKTTILLKVKEELERKQIIVVYIDLSVYRFSPYDFAQNVMSQITKAYAKDLGTVEKASITLGNLLRTLTKLKRLRLTIEPSVDEKGQIAVQIRPEVAETEDYRTVFLLAFDYANEVSKKSRRRIVVIVDEFPNLIEFKRYPKLEAINELLRSIIEQRENVEYVVSGSRVHFMKNILGKGESPLFGHFIIEEIGQLPEKYAVELFMKTARCSQKEAGRAYKLVGGHPYYLIMLAENRNPREHLEETYRRILTNPTGALNLYVNYILKEDLGTSTKETRLLGILKAISQEKSSASQIAKHIKLKLSSLPYYLQELERYDLIQRKDGKYQITDKVVKDYFVATQV